MATQFLEVKNLLTNSPNSAPWDNDFLPQSDLGICSVDSNEASGTQPSTGVEKTLQVNEKKSLANEMTWKWVRAAFNLDTKQTFAEFSEEGNISNRIVFMFPDPPMAESGHPQVISAMNILKKAANPQNAVHNPLKDAIVIIGQSFREAGDRHHTPLDGESKMNNMAGSLVILNGVNSLLKYGVLHEPSVFKRFIIALAIIVIVGYIYARWDSLIGTWTATIVIFGFLLYLSFEFFKYGIWLDFALPLLGIQAHETIKRLEEKWGGHNTSHPEIKPKTPRKPKTQKRRN